MEELQDWLNTELEQAKKEKDSAQQTNNHNQLYATNGKLEVLNVVLEKVNEIINIQNR